MTSNESLTRLVRQSSNLRDYLLHVDGEDSSVLGDALRPFELRGTEAPPPTAEDINALSKAFQKSHDSVIGRIDPYTLGEVLKGRLPENRRTPFWATLFLTVGGFFLVFSAFNFTYWANRATVAVSEAQDFIEFDHFPRLARLVEMKYYFDRIEDETNSGDLEPQLLYLEGIAALQRHYQTERSLPETMDELLFEAEPYRRPFVTLYDSMCSLSDGNGVLAATTRQALGCPEIDNEQSFEEFEAALGQQFSTSGEGAEPGDTDDKLALDGSPSESTPTQTSADQGSSAIASNNELRTEATGKISVFDRQYEVVSELQYATMEKANRAAGGYYQDSLHVVRKRMQELREWLNAVHLWALPIIYGALGSIVYCLWRVLHPTVSPLGFLYTVTRTVFAALAALTLSMLLVPSNILTAGVEMNRPLVYLLSFVFGYSVEVFINTLNMINSYFLQNLTTRPRGAEK